MAACLAGTGGVCGSEGVRGVAMDCIGEFVGVCKKDGLGAIVEDVGKELSRMRMEQSSLLREEN